MRLKDLVGPFVIFGAPNRYLYPYSAECFKACHMYWNNNSYGGRARGNVRRRFSHIVAICRKYDIPMFNYGNNDGGYAYWQQGFALPENCINESIIHELEPYIDYLDLVAVHSDTYLDNTDGKRAFISIGVRWLKRNSYKINKSIWSSSYLRDARAYDKCHIYYSNN